MVSWSKEAWTAISSEFERVKEVKFVQELASGELSEDKFQHYIRQDLWYLNQLSKTLYILSLRIANVNVRDLFIKFSHDTMIMEEAMQQLYLSEVLEVDAISPSTITNGYVLHERKCVEEETVAVALAALLPCYWVYREIGKWIYTNADFKDHPYVNWISLYADESFSDEVDLYISLCDEMARESDSKVQARMTQMFVESTQWECRFFAQSYVCTV